MTKKTKKTLVRRKIREVIEIRLNERIIAYCENCQNEQIFKTVEADKHIRQANEAKQLAESTKEN